MNHCGKGKFSFSNLPLGNGIKNCIIRSSICPLQFVFFSSDDSDSAWDLSKLPNNSNSHHENDKSSLKYSKWKQKINIKLKTFLNKIKSYPNEHFIQTPNDYEANDSVIYEEIKPAPEIKLYRTYLHRYC